MKISESGSILLMKLKLTKHFQERFGERGIDMDDVKSVIRDPDSIVDAFAGKIRVTKRIGDKIIEVVYCREGFRDKRDEFLLITAYYKK